MGLVEVVQPGVHPMPPMRAGAIERYDVADNLGVVHLSSGEALRFGRSACHDFEPAVGVRVLVDAAGPHPLGGERVLRMVRDPGDLDYDAHLAQRDSAASPISLPRWPTPPPQRAIDPELLKRLGNIAAANALVAGGQDPTRLLLAISLDANGKVEPERPTMRFRFDLQRRGPDLWRLAAGINEATAFCRFWMDLELPARGAVDPFTFDLSDAPSFQLTSSKPPDHPRSLLARLAFLSSWQALGGVDATSSDEPLTVDATVMGVELTRMSHAYLPTQSPGQHWVLLKCHRGAQSFWLGFDPSTGEGEVFPRRGEVGSYQLALEFLRTFT